MIKKICLLVVALSLFCNIVLADAEDALENYFGNQKEYIDLLGYEWAVPAINALSQYGLIKDDGGRVYPERDITRAEFTKLVVGAFGLYSFDASCSFSDVDTASEYYPYIASAYELGIIKGVKPDKFGMDEFLLRQDMVTVIYRTALACNIDMSNKPYVDFKDRDEIDDYAMDAVSALMGVNGLSGNLDYKFLPKNNAKFAEACKILYYIMLKNT